MTAHPSAAGIGKAGFGPRALLGLSTQIFLQNFKTIALIGLVVYLPIEIFMMKIAPANVPGLQDQAEITMVESIFDLLLGIVADVLVIRIAANAINGESTAFKSVWSAAKGRYFSSVLATVANSIVLSGLAVLLIVPALAGYVYMGLYLQVVVLRKETGFHALKHSKRLVEGNFWPVAGYTVAFLVGYTAFSFIGELGPTPWLSVLLSGIGDVFNLYFVVASTVLYIHLDRSRFGYDE